MNISSCLSSSTVQHTVNKMLNVKYISLHLQLYSIYILTKSLTHIHPNLTILWRVYILYKFCHLIVLEIYFYLICWHNAQCFCFPIIYAQNYTGTIGSSLCRRHHGFKRTLAKPMQKRLITKEITEKIVADANSHLSLAIIHLATACLHT